MEIGNSYTDTKTIQYYISDVMARLIFSDIPNHISFIDQNIVRLVDGCFDFKNTNLWEKIISNGVILGFDATYIKVLLQINFHHKYVEFR